jgi:hypothetical protein
MVRGAWAIGLLMLCASLPAGAVGDATRSSKLSRARDLYFAGRYQEALPLLDAIASDTGARETDRIESLKYQAFTLYLLKLFGEAKATWRTLLALKPDFELDPVEVSPELIAYFSRIKAIEPSSTSRGPPTPRPTPGGEQPDPGPPAVAEPEAHGCPAWLCLIPFGAGQFANGSPAKGLLFGGAELAFVAGNIALYWARVLSFERDGIVRDETASNRAYVMQHVFLGLFVATAIGGVVEAFVSR